ncbi:MAG: hypothetical protein JSV43_06775 [Methanobacteriota archaeon]|nr:MAG: hypothetical protein JSV43_06775 [Euryarchaeota archaeon]
MRWKGGFVLGLIAFVLVVICLFGPWFSVHMSGSMMGINIDADAGYGLGGITVDMNYMGMDASVYMSYSEVSSTGGDDMIGVFTITQFFVIPALIFTLLFFIFAIAVGLGKMGNGIAVVLGVLGIIFTLMAFIYFAAAIPSTLAQQTTVPGVTGSFSMTGFWGSDTLNLDLGMGMGSINMDVSWGPGYAWYLMIVAFAMILIATIMMIGARPKPKPTVAYTPAVYSMPPTSLHREEPQAPEPGPPF